jgi:regulatory helix-turn-helix LysR family protein
MRMADRNLGRMGLHGMTQRYLDQRLRLSLLRAVDAVEAHRSLLAASSVLGITQPALTKSLHEFEVVGARLFDRHSRDVRPTEAGQVFVEAARRVLAELRRLDDQLDQLASPGGGTVALGALPVAAAGILPEAPWAVSSRRTRRSGCGCRRDAPATYCRCGHRVRSTSLLGSSTNPPYQIALCASHSGPSRSPFWRAANSAYSPTRSRLRRCGYDLVLPPSANALDWN